MQALHKFRFVWGLLAALSIAAAPFEFIRRVEQQLSLVAGLDED